MTTSGNVALSLVALGAIVWAFSLMMRFLTDGIAYLRHGKVVMDHAMVAKGLLLAVFSAVVSVSIVRSHPDYAQGFGVLPLSVLGAAGAMGGLLLFMYGMQRSEMGMSVQYRQPLFMRDRTPGCTSTRHVCVYLDPRGGVHTSRDSLLNLR